ncbi:hypothetical protein BDQ17DRAFT_1412581 [Cyathus striatus]|nr:hypothetical protein BDQ17DRAFT_1412581 [Cyathus striatus]
MLLTLAIVLSSVAFSAANPARGRFSSAEERAALSTRSAQLTCRISSGDGAVNVRSCPSTSCSVVTTVDNGDNVIFTCYTTGTSVFGDIFWDRTGNGHYISEYYIGGDCPYSLPPC